MLDPDLMEELGMKPRVSKEAREEMGSYLQQLADQVKGGNVAGRIKVRMKERHILDGKGIVIPKGRTWMIPEESFNAVNRSVGGKLEKVGAGAPTEREEPKTTKDMKPEDTVKK